MKGETESRSYKSNTDWHKRPNVREECGTAGEYIVTSCTPAMPWPPPPVVSECRSCTYQEAPVGVRE